MTPTTTAAAAPPTWPTGCKTLPITDCALRPDGGAIQVHLEVPNTPENWAALHLFGQMTTLPMPSRATGAAEAVLAPGSRAGLRSGSATPLADSLSAPEPKQRGATAQKTRAARGAGAATATRGRKAGNGAAAPATEPQREPAVA